MNYKNQNKTKTSNLILFTGLVSIIVCTVSMIDVFADHVENVKNYEWHIWSRSLGDGHTDYLNCDSNNDYCALKIRTMGSIQSISQSQVNTEVDNIEMHFDALGKKMSIDRVSVADSYITGANLERRVMGTAIYDLHCTDPGWFGWWCNGKDNHFTKMTVKINDRANYVKFGLAENESADPPIYDIRKTLGHELFHAMGIDHNSSSDSIVFYLYEFGSDGYTATMIDRDDLEARYP